MHIFNGVDMLIVLITGFIVFKMTKGYYESVYEKRIIKEKQKSYEEGLDGMYAIWRDVDKQVQEYRKEKEKKV